MIIMGFLDAIGVASIIPFLALLNNPDIIEKQNFLSNIYRMSGASSPKLFLLWASISYIALLISTLGLRAFTIFLQLRLSLFTEYNISKKLFDNYLHQKYEFFLQKNTADLSRIIISEVAATVNGALMPLLVIFTQLPVCLFVLAVLFYVDSNVAMISGAVFSISYISIYKLLSRLLASTGQGRTLENKERFRVVNEAFAGIKEIKLNGFEQKYSEHFSQPAKKYASYQTTAQLIANLPRFAFEAIAFSGLVGMGVYFTFSGGSIDKNIPLLGVFAFAGYRLMPALQQIYLNASQLKFSTSILKILSEEIESCDEIAPINRTKEQLDLKTTLELKCVKFTHQNSKTPSIKGVSMSIESGQFVGVVGKTGSGKSTLLDNILGLVEPEAGAIFVNGKRLTKGTLQKWKNSIGYVPQQIYLADATLNENIAFGTELDELDCHFIEKCAKCAEIYKFVSEELEFGFKSKVGERGARISGGQRQRIAIARALYSKPSLLILDEATSALDSETEQKVMANLRNWDKKMTIIAVTHRLDTLRNCDQIYVMSSGKIEGSGLYTKLLRSNQTFQSLAGGSISK